jgi:hypothetical protein
VGEEPTDGKNTNVLDFSAYEMAELSDVAGDQKLAI